ncbi:MAG TPA: hypothetical protein VFY93_01335 [Planctomycetota bacterium]|nr:hypothetical protein [Planctomycetota bacterium]
MKSAKDEVRELLDRLPEDASLGEILHHIHVMQRIRVGLEAEAEGRLIPQAEIERRLERWTET